MAEQGSVFDVLDEEHEARAIARAEAQIDAGKGVPHERVREWLKQLARGENVRLPAAFCTALPGDSAMNAPDANAARTAAVAAALDRVHAIAREDGVTPAALARIQAEMETLARQQHLFPAAEFQPPPAGEKGSRRYLLQEDPDGSFALYLLAINPGNESKPHDHTTWAVIAAVEGQELNRVYRRTDAGGREGSASLELVREAVIEPGHGIAYMPADIHSIHTLGDQPTRHLHLYGLALERLDERVGYDLEAGTVQPYNKAFMRPTVNR